MAEDQEIHWDSLSPEKLPILNIVLMGRTGSGKSATANTIIRKRVFESKCKAGGVTMECQTHKVLIPDGPIFNVIDTPGLFDPSVSAEFISTDILRCLTLANGRIDAALIVISVRNRISKEEVKCLSNLQVLFGSKILDYLIVVFIGGDMLEADDETFDDFLRDGCPNFLEEFLILCERRVILFDNKTRDETKKSEQVRRLISLVKQVGRRNKGKPYTNDMYRIIKEETNRHREKGKELESKGFSEEQVATMTKHLQLSYEQNFKEMSEMVEKILKEAMVTQERVTNDMYHIIKNQGETNRHRENEKEFETKRFLEEQVAAMKKELQLSYEQNLKGMSEMVSSQLRNCITYQEETDKHMEKQKELESKGVSEEQDAVMKKELQLSYEQNFKGMSEMLEKTLKEAAEVHEKVINERRRENNDLRHKAGQSLPMAPQCNIM